MSAIELIERLLQACNGHPAAQIPWPHRLLHEAVDTIRTQASRIAELEVQLVEMQKDATRPSAEYLQFLSDVMTAAGLVTHGNQCKALSERLRVGVGKYRKFEIAGEAT